MRVRWADQYAPDFVGLTAAQHFLRVLRASVRKKSRNVREKEWSIADIPQSEAPTEFIEMWNVEINTYLQCEEA